MMIWRKWEIVPTNQFKHSKNKSKSTANRRTGLFFSIPKVRRQMKEKFTNLRIRKEAGVYLAAVFQNWTSKILEVGAIKAAELRRRRKTPAILRDAIQGDYILESVFPGTISLQ